MASQFGPSHDHPSSSTGLNILISGIGVAGPVLTYWLLRAHSDHTITLLERDSQLRATGQSIDIRQAAVDVVRLMGALPAIRERTTSEAGLRFVDGDGGMVAEFPATGDEGEQGFTSEFEILRGDLVDILYELIKDHPRVTTIFDDYVDEYTDDGEQVHVVTKNGKKETYDLVIAADGQSSRIRNIALGTMEDRRKHYRPFNNYAAYFTMPSIPALEDTKFATWYNATKGRVYFIRPDTTPEQCRANIVRQLDYRDEATNERYRSALRKGTEEYRKILLEDFADAGWLTEEILDGLRETTDLYASETAQIQAPTTYVGRVAFVGDAGYCPSPLTGMGTSLAIIGAYILAGEISTISHSTELDQSAENRGSSVESALERYNSIILPFSRKIQNIPTSVPAYLNPQSEWGLWTVRNLLWVVWKTGIFGVIAKVMGSAALSKKTFELPEYTWEEV